MLKLFTCVLWLVIVPGCLGLGCIRYYNKKENWILLLLSGYLVIWGSFEILILPMIYFRISLHVAVYIFMILYLISAAVGLCINYKFFAGWRESLAKSLKGVHWTFWAAIVIIILQTYVSVRYMHLDQDDAFYVATASTAVHTDTLMEVDPYMGFKYEVLPSRYVLSPFPVFTAVWSSLIQIHPTILAHTVLPGVFIPMAYLVYFLLGKRFFANSKRQQGTFLLLCAIIQMFSYYSVYTSGSFLLFRIWQGKAVLVNVLLPLAFYFAIRTVKDNSNKADWVMLFFICTASCLVSSMGIMLTPIMIGIFVLMYAIKPFRKEIVSKSILCCSINIICALIYLYIR